jgi:hypothetical protein
MRTSPYLTAAMTHIINHPEEWDQQDWFCGTKACLAGRICLQVGYVPELIDTVDYTGWVVRRGGEVYSPRDAACAVAGLYRWEAEWLFHPHRTMPELYAAVNRLERDLALETWGARPEYADGGFWVDTPGDTIIGVHRGTSWWCHRSGVQLYDHSSPEAARKYADTIARRYNDLTHMPGHDRESTG